MALPGTLTRVELPLSRLPTGLTMAMPVTVVHGANPGPRVWISAAIHGDELNGVSIIRKVVGSLNPKTLAGSVLAVPVVNVFGVLNQSRYLPDRRDLNRSFPGSKRGSLASQIASTFMQEIVVGSHFGIDLHTGSGGRSNFPQLRCDLDDPKTLKAARAFGAPVLYHASLRDGSLRGAARDLGVPALLYEAGEALRFGTGAIAEGTRGVLRVLRHLGMLTSAPDLPEDRHTVIVRQSEWVRAPHGGFCELRVGLGELVKEQQQIGLIFDAQGLKGVPVQANEAGIVLGKLTQGLVNRGDALVHVGRVEKRLKK